MDGEWKAIGHRIGMVRRHHGLSQVEFANRLCVPLWMIEAAEHGICAEDGKVRSAEPFLLDWQDIFRDISEVFDVSAEWLETGRGKAPDCEASMPEETVVYIPMTLSPAYFRDALSQVALLLDLNAANPYERVYARRRALSSFGDFQRCYISERLRSGRKPSMDEGMRTRSERI